MDPTWEAGKDVAEGMGSSRNAIIEQLWDWYLRRPGARLPKRPPIEVIERAFEAWRKRNAETDQPKDNPPA